MNRPDEQDFHAFAAQWLSSIYHSDDHERIFAHLKEIDPLFSSVPAEQFAMEYLAARLGLAAQVWESLCMENRLPQEAVQKSFLKSVMTTFTAPKFVNLASAFSEYLWHRPGQNQSVPIALSELIFRRIGAQNAPQNPNARSLAASFQTMVEILESLRTSFENDFFEFIHKPLVPPDI